MSLPSVVFKSLAASLGAIALLHSPIAIAQSSTSEAEPDVVIEAEDSPRFTCEYINGEYTVMYYPENQANQAYPWATPTALGGGWTPQKRCETISQRLESYRPDGMQEMRTSIENNYDVVCVTTQADPSCRIVFTVPPGQDPEITRDRVFENLTVADSGDSTQGVTTFVEGNSGSDIVNQVGQILGNPNLGNLGNLGNVMNAPSNGINLRPFLAPSDGGTGTLLSPNFSSPRRSAPRLNPELFR
ncbi:MAG: COP23 domain-containing protein [Spirulinaceae cyanobacterium]